ncbi:MAG: hypothetical protein FD182_1419 [Fusobacteria bacterium]|nr:MAG: hypothetical protein FD182_1419 [Fusobacteriota bacterium]
MYILNFIRGFLMALADSVPGVSGGTIAFILGFYDDFINSLNSLMTKNSMKERLVGLKFLGRLGIGWITGMILSVLFLTSFFESSIYSVSSLFTGFVLLSIPLIIIEERENIVGKYKNLIFTLIGIIVVVLLTFFNPSSNGSGVSLAFGDLNLFLIIYVFVAAMIAISAMVLPGISGSSLLLIFGIYTGIISSIRQVLSLNFNYLPILIIFTFGVLAGIATTIKSIRYVLRTHRTQAIYTIIGLMLGSLYAIFEGPTTLEIPHPAMTFETFDFLFFFIGAALIFALDRIKVFFQKK